MATGGNLERTVGCSSDDDDESQNASADGDTSTMMKYRCTPCAESSNVKEAFHYCTECEEFYCDQCQRFHSRMAKLRHHVVYGKSDKNKWGQKAPSKQLTEKCQKHPTETINMICWDHNELCCPVCISLDHITCQNKEYIPSAANGITESDKFTKVEKKLKKDLTKAYKYKSKRKGSINYIQLKQNSFLAQIADMRRQVNDTFDEMEERVTLGLTHLSNTLHVNVREEINLCDELKKEIANFSVKLGNKENHNECQKFTDMIRAENMLEKAKGGMEKLKATCSNENAKIENGLKFNLNTNLHQKLKEIKIFGEVSCTYNIKCTYKIKHRDYMYYGAWPYTYLDCCIEGMVQLDDGTYILADSSHFCLKLLSSTYMVKGKHDLTEPPTALCIIGAKQVAVSLKNRLEVFMIDREVTHMQHLGLHFSHPCRGLAYFNQRYYITDYNDTLYIYNETGSCIKEIQTDSYGSPFASVRNIAIGADGSKIYMTDIDKGLVTLDMNGQVLSCLETKDTKGAYGVCLTTDGRVLVSNYLQDKVIEVDKDGKNVLEKNLISLPAERSPKSICYDRQNSCVLVSDNYLGGSGYVSVFQL